MHNPTNIERNRHTGIPGQFFQLSDTREWRHCNPSKRVGIQPASSNRQLKAEFRDIFGWDSPKQFSPSHNSQAGSTHRLAGSRLRPSTAHRCISESKSHISLPPCRAYSVRTNTPLAKKELHQQNRYRDTKLKIFRILCKPPHTAQTESNRKHGRNVLWQSVFRYLARMRWWILKPIKTIERCYI